MSLINKEKLEREMYHNAFEIDTDLQKWDSGCWIRYKMFENVIEEQPTVKAIPVEWLKNKSKDLAEAYWNNVRNKLVLNMNELPLVIDEIVRIWEKENENR